MVTRSIVLAVAWIRAVRAMLAFGAFPVTSMQIVKQRLVTLRETPKLTMDQHILADTCMCHCRIITINHYYWGREKGRDSRLYYSLDVIAIPGNALTNLIAIYAKRANRTWLATIGANPTGCARALAIALDNNNQHYTISLIGASQLTGSHWAPFLQLHSFSQFEPNLLGGHATMAKIIN